METSKRKWYVVQVSTGYEKKVKSFIEEKVRALGDGVPIGEVLLPIETLVESKKDSKEKTSEKMFFPGYVLVNMEMKEQTWHFIKEIPRVNGFVGEEIKSGRIDPALVSAIEDEEIVKLKSQIQEGTLKPKLNISFEQGETVQVVEGPFANLSGVIREINPEKGKVLISVSIFGRSTPIELDFNQIEQM
ncbi:MAG: transcription termination/antitermination factor NusG [Candidatus Mycalebacterium zealandia]|nr:MAG: transcription termination/antitermination factor NusG [Candidatus Mycalebacterium zealandia]